MRHLPTVLGEPISALKMEELWRAFDPDLSGEIDMSEFASDKCKEGVHLKTQQGVTTFKGHAVDPTLAFAHVTDRNSVVQEKTYGITGAKSQVVSAGKPQPAAAKVNRDRSASDNSTTVCSSPGDSTVAETPLTQMPVQPVVAA